MESVIVSIIIEENEINDFEIPTTLTVEKLISIICLEKGLDEKKFKRIKLVKEKVILGGDQVIGDSKVYDGTIIQIL